MVLRNGKLTGERTPKTTTRLDLSELMVGRAIVPPKLDDMPRGAPLVSLVDVSARRDGRVLDKVSFELHKHEILGVVGVSGHGQALLAGVLSGTVVPRSGQVKVQGKDVREFSPTEMIERGVARIPGDRHREGSFADMSVTENLIAERYRTDLYSRRGWMDWRGARAEAEKQIEKHDIKCPSAAAPVRLMSIGYLQKMILSRSLAGDAKVIVANQPTRGLDLGATGFVHEQLLAARRKGAAILLISEDLDEIQSLSDRICVMYCGTLSEPLWRSEVKFADIGLLMAGKTPEKKVDVHAA
jgi:general nucleoside transport system ATP-binding protein